MQNNKLRIFLANLPNSFVQSNKPTPQPCRRRSRASLLRRVGKREEAAERRNILRKIEKSDSLRDPRHRDGALDVAGCLPHAFTVEEKQ